MDVKISRGNSHFGNTSLHHRPCLEETDYLLPDIKPTAKSPQNRRDRVSAFRNEIFTVWFALRFDTSAACIGWLR